MRPLSVFAAIGALLRDDKGATMVEYAVIAAALVIPIIAFGAAVASECGTVLSGYNTGWVGQVNTPI